MRPKPHRKPDRTDKPDKPEKERSVDDENSDAKSNEQEEEGGGYARPRTDQETAERPNRGS